MAHVDYFHANFPPTLIGLFSVVIDELVEFEKQPIEVQYFRELTDRFSGIYGMYLKLIKENQKITTCNLLDLETLGCHYGSFRMALLLDRFTNIVMYDG